MYQNIELFELKKYLFSGYRVNIWFKTSYIYTFIYNNISANIQCIKCSSNTDEYRLLKKCFTLDEILSLIDSRVYKLTVEKKSKPIYKKYKMHASGGIFVKNKNQCLKQIIY